MKKVKAFFKNLFCGRLLVLPIVFCVVILTVVLFGVVGKGNDETDIPTEPVNIEEVVEFSSADTEFNYLPTEDGYKIVGIKSGAKFKTNYIVFPTTFNGKEVVEIEAQAFRNNSNFRGVILPSTIKVIGESAFENCVNLKIVSIGADSLVNEERGLVIGVRAFAECNSLNELKLGAVVCGVCENAFSNTAISTLYVESDYVYTGLVSRGAMGGVLRNGAVVLVSGVDNATNSYLNEFYTLSSRVVDDKTYVEYTLKGNVIILSLDAKGGDVAGGNEIEFFYGNEIELPTPTYSGYIFKGWYTDVQNNASKVEKIDGAITADTTLYAKWETRLNSVTYVIDVEEGENVSNPNLEFYFASGSDLVLQPLSRVGYVFVGWYEEETYQNKVSVIKKNRGEDLTLYARFEPLVTIDNSGTIVGVGEHAMSLGSMVIPDVLYGKAVSRIGNNAFENCTSLVTLIIDAPITSIGDYAFAGCSSLKTVTITSSERLESIGEGAFMNATALTGFSVNKSTHTIGEMAFKNCKSLAKFEFVGSSYIGEIKRQTFMNCVNLASINLTNSIVNIGEEAFYGCASLTSASFNNLSLESIGNRAFSGNSSLAKFTLDGSLITLGEAVFENCSSLLTVNISDDFSIETLPNSTFKGCEALTEINLKENIKIIGESAFENCYKLNSVLMGNALSTIFDRAFANTAISTITIPNSVGLIGMEAFLNTDLVEFNIQNIGCWWTAEKTNSGYTIKNYQDIKNGVELIGLIKVDGVALCCEEPFVIDNTTIIGLTESGKVQPRLIIPDYITSVDCGAFCDAVAEVVLEFSKPLGWFYRDGESLCEIKIDNGGGNSNVITILNSNSIVALDLLLVENGVLVGVTEDASLVEEMIIYEGITEIKKGAISGLEKLKSVVLPTSLIKIEAGAFSNLTALESVKFIDGTYWYLEDETALVNIDAKNSEDFAQKIVGEYQTKAIVKKEMFKILGDTLVGLTDLGKLQLVLELPDFIRIIGEYAFDGSEMVNSIIVPKSIVEFKDYAFAGLTSLKTIYFKEGSKLEKIGDRCFYNCAGLEQFTFPSSVTTFGKEIFMGATSLTKVEFLGEITKITDGMFYACKGLKEVVGIDEITEIGYKAFYWCYSLESIVLPSSLETIGNYAFAECSKLVDVQFNDGLIEIGNGAFYGCTSLTDVVLTDSVKTVGDYAFVNCKSMFTFTFGANIINIGAHAFESSSVNSIIFTAGGTFRLISGVNGAIENFTMDVSSPSMNAYNFIVKYNTCFWTKN